jgi:flagellar biosynthesis protein FlhG
MHDQARHLRQLVSHAADAAPVRERPRSGLLAVAGGKGGSGTTTVAVNLAVELARSGRRTALVDADPDGGNVAVMCGLEDRYTITDVAAGRRSACEALCEGPERLQILPGAWAVDSLAELPAESLARLAAELDALAERFDVVVADAGNGRSSLARRLWQAAGEIVVVTTAELASVMGVYGSIKVLAPAGEPVQIRSLVNMAPGLLSAGGVQRRLAQACARFLGIKISPMGYLDEDPQIAESTGSQRPFVMSAPQGRSARQVRRLSTKLSARLPAVPARRAG